MLNHILKTSIFIGFIFTHSFNAIASVADSESCALPSFHKTAHSVYKLTNTGFETVLNANSSVIRVDFLSFGRLANQNPIPTFKLVEQRMSKALYQAGANIFVEFLKEKNGLRQNFNLIQKPNGNGPVVLTFYTNSPFNISTDHKEISFFHENTQVLNLQSLQVFDANKKPIDARFEKINNHKYTIVFDDTNAAYPILVDPLATTALNEIESNASNALFGSDISSAGDVNGDGYSDVIVAASNFTNGQQNEGKAFVFLGSPDGLQPVPNWIFETNQSNATISAVSTTADLNGDGYSDIVVASKNYDNGNSNYGKIWVFHGSASGLALSPSSTYAFTQGNADFGFALATLGDINKDGFSDIAIGAPKYSNTAAQQGAVFVFMGSAIGLGNTYNTMFTGNHAQSFLGTSLSSAGDVNGDGFFDMIIGQPGYSNNETNEGNLLLFLGSNIGFGPAPNFQFESNQTDAKLGSKVSACGDYDGDGYSDFAAAAPFYNNSNTDAGRVFIFKGNAMPLSITNNLNLEGTTTNQNFGRDLHLGGDFNADGFADLIVSSNSSSTSNGQVMVYFGNKNGLQLAWSKTGSGAENFGASVSSAGDIDGDGYSDLAIGAPLFSNNESTEGKIYTFAGFGDMVENNASWITESNSYGAKYGFSVSGIGDVNGDGFDDVAVGAVEFSSASIAYEGKVYVYYGTSTGLPANPSWTMNGGAYNVAFGCSVAKAGDVNGDGFDDLLVGAKYYSNGQYEEGKAFLYFGSVNGLSTVANWTGESNQNSAFYGYAVAGGGDINADGFDDIIIGAPFYDNGQNNEGAVFIYLGSSNGPSTTPQIILESNQANAQYGYSLNFAGDINDDRYADIIVGAYQFDAGHNNEGKVFIYHGSPTGINSTPNWTFEGNQTDSWLGWYVNGIGDINADGYDDVALGANIYSGNIQYEGAVFVFHGSASGLGNNYNWMQLGGQHGCEFGYCFSSAGDVNRDGYGDVVIAAFSQDNGLPNIGRAYLFAGSATGLSSSVWQQESTQAQAYFSQSLYGAGDVNGDGFSDIIVGERDYDNGQNNEGRAHLFYGNKTFGLQSNINIYNNDFITPVNASNMSDKYFCLGQKSKSYIGNTSAKLLIETKANGQMFSNIQGSITNYTGYNVAQLSYSQLATGIELKQSLVKKGYNTKVRSRIKFNPTNAIDGQMCTPWTYMPEKISGNTFSLEVERNSLGLRYLNCDQIAVSWQEDAPSETLQYIIIESLNGAAFNPIDTLTAIGYSNEFIISHTERKPLRYLQLIRIGKNGESSYTGIEKISLPLSCVNAFSFWPNPAIDLLYLNNPSNTVVDVEVLSATGQLLTHTQVLPITSTSLLISDLPVAVYYLRCTTQNETKIYPFIKTK